MQLPSQIEREPDEHDNPNSQSSFSNLVLR
jgi:hypothetical protein